MIDSASLLSLTESLSRSGKQYDKKDIVLFSSYESRFDWKHYYFASQEAENLLEWIYRDAL